MDEEAQLGGARSSGKLCPTRFTLRITASSWHVYLLRVTNGSTSPSDGIAIEEEVRRLAARLGIAELVMIPVVEAKGNATREISDGCLVSGDRGVILQVKSRDPEAAAADDQEKALAWARREIRRGTAQGRGSRRRLMEVGRPVQMLPMRVLDVAEDRQAEFARTMPDATGWPCVVIIDHPAPIPLKVAQPDDVLAITIGDWENLFRVVRSVAGVIDYVHRAINIRSVVDVPLGHEEIRFRALCDADANAPGPPTSLPWLSTAALEYPEAADFFGHLMNRMWPNDAALPLIRTGDYVPALAFLDRVPSTMRVIVGRKWLQYLEGALRDGHRSGLAITPSGPLVSFFEATDSDGHEDRFAGQLLELTIHRARLVAEHIAPMPVLGVGVLKQASHTDYLFVFLPDAKRLPDQTAELAALIDGEFGSPNQDLLQTYQPGSIIGP